MERQLPSLATAAFPVAAPVSAAVEEYLHLIYSMEHDGESVIAARIAERLHLAPPTAWAMLRRMARSGLIESNDEDRQIRLSPQGEATAEAIIRRQMLAECFLVDILKVDWYKAHTEARRLEHAISPRVESQISKLLNKPTVCPHGNIIPGHGGSQAAVIPLAAARTGEEVVVDHLLERDAADEDLMTFLSSRGLVPGTALRIGERLADSDLVAVITSDGEKITLGGKAAASVRVRRA